MKRQNVRCERTPYVASKNITRPYGKHHVYLWQTSRVKFENLARVVVSAQSEAMGNSFGKFFFIVRNENECLVRTQTKLLDNLADKATVAVVETVKRFVKDE